MTEPENTTTRLWKSFPALSQLEIWRPRQKIPFVQQLEASDCGAACLSMVLGMHGRHTTLTAARLAVGSGRGGVSAQSILDAAAKFQLPGRGVRLEPDELEFLPAGSIIHWGFNHFVLYEGRSRKHIRLIDPAVGPRVVSRETFDKQFTGIALIFERDPSFEPTDRVQSSWMGYWRHILSHRGLVIRTVVLSLLIQLFVMALPILTGVLVDQIVPHKDLQLLQVLGIGLIAVVIFNFLASLVRSNLLLYLRTLLDTQLGLGFMDHLVRLPYGFFLERPTGDLLVRYHSNQRVREILTSASLSALLDGALVSLYLIVLVVLSPMIALLTVSIGAVHCAVFAFTGRRYRELANQDIEVRARSNSHLVEMISGMETLKSLGAEGRSLERWSHRFVDELNVALAQGRLQAWIDATRASLRIASPLIILVSGGVLVMDGHLTLGTMLALSALSGSFLAPLDNLVWTAFELQEVRSHLERISDVTEATPEGEASSTAPVAQLCGEIALERVSFRYHRDHEPVLRDVSERFEPGQKVAIVGRSGSGKSTLARLISGLYQPTSGRVLFDGLDLAGLNLQEVRQHLGVVTQEAHLFGTSIRNNIMLGNPSIDSEAMINAARLAEIHEEILDMPMGYDLLLTDGGASLSGGQRQRIALARALIRKPPILLLDEATSDLDAVTESRIMASLKSINATCVIIAHRLSTVVDADLILVMEGGRVTERGTHEQLVALNGAYSALIAAQATL